MQGDFSRITFDRVKHVSTVLSQQGRVTLDADFNEAMAVLLHQLRTAVADLVGPAGAPIGPDGGFEIATAGTATKEPDLTISPGRMYVDGLLVENDADAATYWDQPDGYLDADIDDDRLPDAPYLVYLRVWERLITAVEDPSIREIALGDLGPDSSARAKVIWQVAATPSAVSGSPPGPPSADAALIWLTENFQRTGGQIPLLQVRAKRPDDADDDLCDVSPESRYRGLENQLYRIQVHTGGGAQTLAAPASGRSRGRRGAPPAVVAQGATWMWSRENASVVAPIASISGNLVRLASLGRDGKTAFDAGDWVEIVDDAYAARVADDAPAAPAPPLRRIRSVDVTERLVTLEDDPSGGYGRHSSGTDPGLHPLLRRWDHRPTASTEDGRVLKVGTDGALPLVTGTWIGLEDGIEIRFAAPDSDEAPRYRRGDWWAIPARVVTGDVWPADDEAMRPPDGVVYHYAPLAWVGDEVADLRMLFPPATGSARPDPLSGDSAPSRSRTGTPAKATRRRAPRNP
ncbi:DUF6519 domain-containing protein [Actinoplanes sp. CA-051413]|uniref:DUF6519 domain-containing protein n=1 Tax=Actinoplanes sp. CA-051413 TaxID=3239899 RepID=UPI003D99A540